MRTDWSHERTELCVKLWNQGYSASQVARMLGNGVTRNAVIGKIFRLNQGPADRVIKRKPTHKKVMARRKRIRESKPAKHRSGIHATRWGKTPPMIPAEPAPLPPEPPTPDKLVSFADLEPGMCRFIFGDPRTPEHGFCGCKTAPGATYCPGHQALCTSRAKPTRRRITHIPSTNAGIVSADKALEAIQ